MRARKAAFGLITSVVVFVAPTGVSAAPGDSADTSKRVVILNATDPYLPAFLVLDDSLRGAIRTQRSEPTELYAESLDMHRFPQAQFGADLVALLRKKYRGLKIDVVVAAAPIALDFAQHHRADVWPGAAIVFHSVPETLLPTLSLDPDIVGVPVQLDFAQTLTLALKLRPATRRIVVVAGRSEPDQRHLALARAALQRHFPTREIEYLVGRTLADTVAAVQALPSDAAVLYLMMFRDGSGAPKVPRDVLARIAAVSGAPVFGVFETYLGHGIVAGSIASYREQGRRAGELVVRLLSGEAPSQIRGQTAVRSKCMADWRQLRRWQIDERRLPADCEVRFKEVTAWDRYQVQIITALAVILAQAALILALTLQRRRLGLAQRSLADECGRRAEAESLAARLRARLSRFSKERSVGTMAAAIAHEINQPLIAIQNYAQAVKRRLESDRDDTPKLIELVTKIEGQAERAGDITQRVRSLVSRRDVQLLPVSLCDLFEEVIRMMEPEIRSRGCEIVCKSAADRPTVLADSLQAQLVLVNLLQNAMQSVSASDRYDKRLSVEVRRADEESVLVSVTDRGPGVVQDRVADIFEPLYSSNGGMGMGLAIAQTIVEAHGGRLWYERSPTGGAIFHFTLRAARS